MDPITLAAIGMGLQAFGSFEASQATASALGEQASAARRNAKMAKLEAQFEAEARVIQARKMMGEQVTDFAAAGVSGGSPFAVMSESLVNAEMDRLSVLFGGNIRSRNFMAEAEGKAKAARRTREAGVIGLLGAGFSGSAKISEF